MLKHMDQSTAMTSWVIESLAKKKTVEILILFSLLQNEEGAEGGEEAKRWGMNSVSMSKFNLTFRNLLTCFWVEVLT